MAYLALAIEGAGFQRTLLWIVTFEVAGIDIHAPNNSRQTQAYNAPIKPWRAAPARLPAVHPFAEIGIFVFDENRRASLEQVLFRGKEFVIGKQHRSTKSLCGQID